nr:putative endochitinase [Quercus suber]
MASNASTRKSFIDSSITIGRPYNFHDLDLDWEFSSTTTDMTNLGLLFKEWREAVEKESKNSNKPQLLLTAAVYYSSVFRSLSYPAEAMENNLDWIDVMAFDFGAPTWKPNLTEAPAALYNPFTPANGADITADGALGYTHIRNRIIGQGGAITAFNCTFAPNHCYNGTTWVGYDDVKSILAKVLYAKGKGLLGYFAWRVGFDDNWTLCKTV